MIAHYLMWAIFTILGTYLCLVSIKLSVYLLATLMKRLFGAFIKIPTNLSHYNGQSSNDTQNTPKPVEAIQEIIDCFKFKLVSRKLTNKRTYGSCEHTIDNIPSIISNPRQNQPNGFTHRRIIKWLLRHVNQK